MNKKYLGYAAIVLGLFIVSYGASSLLTPKKADYGATSTHIVGGDLSVVGNTTYTGTVTNTGLITANGGITDNGSLTVSGSTNVNMQTGTGNVVVKREQVLTNATSTPCAFQNTTGVPLEVALVHYWEATSTSPGTTQVTMGTSTNAFTTSTSPLVNTVITKSSTVTVNVATSTLAGGGIMWEPNDWITAFTSTTTHAAGECAVLVL